jgi:hypothetical protein
MGAEHKEPARMVGDAPAGPPMTSDDALRLAIKLAVDAGDFERATALLEVARRMATQPATITPIALVRDRDRR